MPRKKHGGRQKGTPNKNRIPLMELSEELDCDPFEILLLFASGDFMSLGLNEITPDQRLKAAIEACAYLHPKRKALEHSGPDGGAIQGEIKLTIRDYTVGASKS